MPEIASTPQHALAPIAPKGHWVMQLETRSLSYNSVYDNEGDLKALGHDYAIDLNAAVFPLLALFGPGATLGTSSLSGDVSVQGGKVTLGYGVTENLTVGIISTFGQSKSNVNFSVSGGNIGWNPAYNPLLPPAITNSPFAPVGAGAAQAMNATDINTIISDPAFGYAYKPLHSSSSKSMGTVLAGFIWRFYEGEYGSLIVGLGIRESFVPEDDPDNLSDVPLGNGSRDIVAQLDYLQQISSLFDIRFGVKRTIQLADKITARVAPPGQALALLSTKEVVNRNLADFWEYEAEIGVSYHSWRVSGTWYRYLKKCRSLLFAAWSGYHLVDDSDFSTGRSLAAGFIVEWRECIFKQRNIHPVDCKA